MGPIISNFMRYIYATCSLMPRQGKPVVHASINTSQNDVLVLIETFNRSLFRELSLKALEIEYNALEVFG